MQSYEFARLLINGEMVPPIRRWVTTIIYRLPTGLMNHPAVI